MLCYKYLIMQELYFLENMWKIGIYLILRSGTTCPNAAFLPCICTPVTCLLLFLTPHHRSHHLPKCCHWPTTLLLILLKSSLTVYKCLAYTFIVNLTENVNVWPSGPARRLQRINSQEELDFQESSSGSDQSELCGEDSIGELDWTPSQEQIFERLVMKY